MIKYILIFLLLATQALADTNLVRQKVCDKDDITKCVDVESTGHLNVTTVASNGIPTTYTKITSASKLFLVNKGQLNKVKIRPSVLNEHAESSREVMDIASSDTVVGQIFKASADNISGILLTMESAA